MQRFAAATASSFQTPEFPRWPSCRKTAPPQGWIRAFIELHSSPTKKSPDAGAGALPLFPKKGKHWVSYAKHTTRYGELPGPAGGLLFNVR